MTAQPIKHARIAEKVVSRHEKIAKTAYELAKAKHPELPTLEDFHDAFHLPCGELISSLIADEGDDLGIDPN